MLTFDILVPLLPVVQVHLDIREHSRRAILQNTKDFILIESSLLYKQNRRRQPIDSHVDRQLDCTAHGGQLRMGFTPHRHAWTTSLQAWRHDEKAEEALRSWVLHSAGARVLGVAVNSTQLT